MQRRIRTFYSPRYRVSKYPNQANSPRRTFVFLCFILFFITCFLTGCGKTLLPGQNKNKELAEAAVQRKDYPQAVRFYESALDGTSKTADIHYRLAIIYDSYLDDPISALHHYRRFLRMAEENDRRISEVHQSTTRIERILASKLSQGGLISKTEAVRIRNENLELRKQLVQLQKNKDLSKTQSSTPTSSPPHNPKSFSTVPQTAAAEKLIGSETRTYTVQPGDTLASISRKFYKTSNRWKDIADANHNQLEGKTNIREGQILIIP